MNYEQLHASFGAFTDKLYRLLEDDEHRTWTRFNKEVYNHKRNIEISVWHGSGNDERGHVFLATSAWEGDLDWDRIKAIVFNDELALGPDDHIVKVWDLSRLKDQTAPQPRCAICGKLE